MGYWTWKYWDLSLVTLSYVIGQISVDIYQELAMAQSCFVRNRIKQLAQAGGAQMRDGIKLVGLHTFEACAACLPRGQGMPA